MPRVVDVGRPAASRSACGLLGVLLEAADLLEALDDLRRLGPGVAVLVEAAGDRDLEQAVLEHAVVVRAGLAGAWLARDRRPGQRLPRRGVDRDGVRRDLARALERDHGGLRLAAELAVDREQLHARRAAVPVELLLQQLDLGAQAGRRGRGRAPGFASASATGSRCRRATTAALPALRCSARIAAGPRATAARGGRAAPAPGWSSRALPARCALNQSVGARWCSCQCRVAFAPRMPTSARCPPSTASPPRSTRRTRWRSPRRAR